MKFQIKETKERDKATKAMHDLYWVGGDPMPERHYQINHRNAN